MSRLLYYCKLLFCTLIVSSTVTLAFFGFLFIVFIKIPNDYYILMFYIALAIFIISTMICFTYTYDKIDKTELQKKSKSVTAETKRIKLDFNVYQQIANKERSFILCSDMYDIKPNDTLLLIQAVNHCQTGNILTKKVKFVLKGCLDDGLKNGYCIVQF